MQTLPPRRRPRQRGVDRQRGERAARARLIDAGGLDESDGGRDLGDRLGLGERQVRRLFGKHLGAPPVAVAQAKRLAAANALIDAGALPMAEVALAAGFGSVRRFNELYRAVHGETPARAAARAS